METEILNPLYQVIAEYGALGTILAFVLWTNYKLTNRLFKVIENNTSAFTELKNSINMLKRSE